jgi:tRNA(Glu) U13 pseudouridine synthase TruD
MAFPVGSDPKTTNITANFITRIFFHALQYYTFNSLLPWRLVPSSIPTCMQTVLDKYNRTENTPAAHRHLA